MRAELADPRPDMQWLTAHLTQFVPGLRSMRACDLWTTRVFCASWPPPLAATPARTGGAAHRDETAADPDEVFRRRHRTTIVDVPCCAAAVRLVQGRDSPQVAAGPAS